MPFYSNEIVFRGHPDKVADQISDALLDAYLAQDKSSRCGIEVVGGKGKIFVTGEVTSTANVDVGNVVKSVLSDVGYRTDYEIIDNLGRQSPDVAMGVDTGGAGDQGIMFGFACRDTEEYLPTAMVILQKFAREYDDLRRKDSRFLPDGKAQITGAYDDWHRLKHIHSFTISYQNTETDREETDFILREMVHNICKRYGVSVSKFIINPTGKFLIGGFDGDAGLTGRKIAVDNYHSFFINGAGAFSGKDPTKVDRSAAYKARNIAIQFMKYRPEIDNCSVQLAYAIGVKEPLSVNILADGKRIDPTLWYAECAPEKIIQKFDLKNFHYCDTAKFGHFGDKSFPWEKIE